MIPAVISDTVYKWQDSDGGWHIGRKVATAIRSAHRSPSASPALMQKEDLQLMWVPQNRLTPYDSERDQEDVSKTDEWQTEHPPNETPVIVECNGVPIVVEAIYGRDGLKPHWRAVNNGMCWPPNAFSRWKPYEESEINDE